MQKLQRIILLLVISIFSTFVAATTFNPLTIEKQVEEATGAAEVELVSLNSYKKQTGQIFTQYNFKIIEGFNVDKNDLNNNLLSLDLIGGTFQSETAVVDGGPEFKIGDKSFLLLKKIESKTYLSNFTLGKYKIQNIDGETYYISDVFPLVVNVGRISKSKMIDLMKDKWHLSYNINLVPDKNILKSSPEIQNQKSISKTEKLVDREIASNIKKDAFDDRNILILIFVIIGLILSFFILKFKK